MDKQCMMVHALNGVLFSLRRQDMLTPAVTQGVTQCVIQLNKPVTEGQTLNDPLI